MVLVAKLASMMLNLLPDIDECRLTSSPCSQLCSNSQGSYKCGCRRGYELVRGGLCRGKVTFSCSTFYAHPYADFFNHTFLFTHFILTFFMLTFLMLNISCPSFSANLFRLPFNAHFFRFTFFHEHHLHVHTHLFHAHLFHA